MTTIVTGANGHLGGNLVRQLIADGEPVRAMVHRSRDALAGVDVELVPGNVLDPESLARAFRGADTVVHAAALISIKGGQGGAVEKMNVNGARNVAQAAQAAGAKLVHVSSIHAFDMRDGGPVDEFHPRPGPTHYAYDQSKWRGEQAVQKFVADGLDGAIVNPTAVIGPNDFAPSRMGQVFLDLHGGRMPALIKGGFDFVDVRDVSAGIIAAAKRGKAGQNYLLGGRFQTIAELANIAASVAGFRAPRTVLPAGAALLGLPFAAIAAKISGNEPKFTRESIGTLRHGCPVDHGKAQRDLGYRPRPLEQTIADLYADFTTRGVLQ